MGFKILFNVNGSLKLFKAIFPQKPIIWNPVSTIKAYIYFCLETVKKMVPVHLQTLEDPVRDIFQNVRIVKR